MGAPLSSSDIFISYSRDDRAIVKTFARALMEQGFSVWWDDALRSGDTFDEVIERELRAARAVVVLWSPTSVKSRWVRAEATLADRRSKLVPALIEPCDRPIIFELSHTVDLSHWSGDQSDPSWMTFISDVRRVVGRSDVAQAKNEPKADQRESSRPSGSAAIAGEESKKTPDAQALESYLLPDDPAAEDGSESDQFAQTQIFTSSHSAEHHWLLSSSAGESDKKYVVGPLGLKIGRVAPADVVLPDARVSRSHCLVQLKEGELHVSDLSSTNGTFVDDQRVGGVAVLPVGSVLRIADFSLVHEVRTDDAN